MKCSDGLQLSEEKIQTINTSTLSDIESLDHVKGRSAEMLLQWLSASI